MTRPNAHFQPIAELPSEHGFTIWGYGTRDDIAAVVAPGYFQGHAARIKRGDLLLVNSTTGPRDRPAVTKVLYHVDLDLNGRIQLTEVTRHGLPAGIGPTPAGAREPAKPKGGAHGEPGRTAAAE